MLHPELPVNAEVATFESKIDASSIEDALK